MTNGNSAKVSVVDGTSNIVFTTIDLGSTPYGVAVDPKTNRVYVTNIYRKTVSVIHR